MRTYLLIFFLYLNSTVYAYSDSNEYCLETLNFFKKLIQINSENSGYIKWNKDIKVYFHDLARSDRMANNTVYETEYNELKNELGIIINQLNDWIEPIKIMAVDQPESANFEVFIGSVSECKLLDPTIRFTMAKNWGIYHNQLSDNGNQIIKSSVFIDLYRTPNLRVKKKLLYKKIAQALGFFHENDDIKESVFYSGFSEHTNYTNTDKELIQLLYNSTIFEREQINMEKITAPLDEISAKLNLFTNNVTLSISQNLMGKNVIFYNMQGQQIIQINLESTETIINISDFQSGVYFLRIDNLPAVKIIKQ
ncbi:MAG: T9SS type A sorting domain-containing protein [Bacteroidota bacterium]